MPAATEARRAPLHASPTRHSRVSANSQRLHERFPKADFYLIIDDDVFINKRRLLDYVHHRDPKEVALYGPGFCDWGVPEKVRKRIREALPLQVPDFIHVVIGGIMLFTAEAVRRFTDATVRRHARHQQPAFPPLPAAVATHAWQPTRACACVRGHPCPPVRAGGHAVH